MLTFSVISSGSRANCIYVASAETRLLVDCGLSGKKAAGRLDVLGIDADSIDAIVVSHEHDDHVSGVKVFAHRHKTKVFANRNTITCSKVLSAVDVNALRVFTTGQTFSIGDIQIDTFPVEHDAVEPVGFRVTCGGQSLGIVTDLGHVTTIVRSAINDLDALVLEANHDTEMLLEAPYPWEIKQRIKSRKGHLHNEAAGSLLTELAAPINSRLQVVVAAHISEKSNTPKQALTVLKQSWDRSERGMAPSFVAGSPFEASPLFTLS